MTSTQEGAVRGQASGLGTAEVPDYEVPMFPTDPFTDEAGAPSPPFRASRRSSKKSRKRSKSLKKKRKGKKKLAKDPAETAAPTAMQSDERLDSTFGITSSSRPDAGAAPIQLPQHLKMRSPSPGLDESVRVTPISNHGPDGSGTLGPAKQSVGDITDTTPSTFVGESSAASVSKSTEGTPSLRSDSSPLETSYAPKYVNNSFTNLLHNVSEHSGYSPVRQGSYLSGLTSVGSGNTEKWNVVASIMAAETEKDHVGWSAEEAHFYRMARSSIYGQKTITEEDEELHDQLGDSVISDIGNSVHSYNELLLAAAAHHSIHSRSELSPQTTATLQTSAEELGLSDENAIMVQYLTSMGVRPELAAGIAKEASRQMLKQKSEESRSPVQQKHLFLELKPSSASTPNPADESSVSIGYSDDLEKGNVSSVAASAERIHNKVKVVGAERQLPGVQWIQKNVYEGPLRQESPRNKKRKGIKLDEDEELLPYEEHYEDLMEGSFKKKKKTGIPPLPGWMKSRFFVISVVAAILLILSGALAGVLISSSAPMVKSSPSPTVGFVFTTSEPSPSPTTMSPTVIDPEIREMAAGISGYDLVSRPSTPQSLAVGWLSTFDSSGYQSGDNFISRYVLIVLYYSLEGEKWRDNFWLEPDLHHCNWGDEIQCRGDDVTGLRLIDFGARGELPMELKHLRLETLIMNGNELYGQIPEDLCGFRAWKGMNMIDLQDNKLSGTIPSDIGSCDKIAILTFANNRLSGTLPDSFSKLTNLKSFSAERNDITGRLDNGTLDGLRDSLEEFNVRMNRFEGGYPNFLSFSKLRRVNFDFNRMSGPIPWIAHEIETREVLTISHNNFNGTLFPDVDTVDTGEFVLSVLDVSFNQFSGTFPAFSGLLPSLRMMDLSNNQFTGEWDLTAFGGFPILEHLSIANNLFTGQSNAEGFYLGDTLRYLDISGNLFTGQIPDGVWSNGRLAEYLAVGRNQFKRGTIPSRIGTFSNLRYFNADDCGLTGTIPTEVSKMVLLETFSVVENDLVGEVPAGFASLANLEILELAGNNLSGTFPEKITALSSLKVVSLSENTRLSGYVSQDTCDRMNVTAREMGCDLMEGGSCVIESRSCDFPSR